MFRPLLSSVPSSTFYAGKGTTLLHHHSSLASRNSSIATSSNASSDQGTSGAHDIEGRQNPDDVSRIPDDDDDDDGVFVVDRVDDVSDRGEEDDDDNGGGNISESEVCSKCRRGLPSVELIAEGDQWLCQKCRSSESNPAATETVEADQCPDDGGELGHERKESSLNLSPVPNVDIQEGKGISLLLLKRSSSAQGCIVPSRSYTASNTSYDDFSYSRSSISMSSSLDLGRQTASRLRRQPSGSKSDVENYGYANYERCSGSSTSGASGNVMSGSLEDGFRVTTAAAASGGGGKDIRVHDQSLNSEAESTCTDVGSGTICKTATDEPSPLEEATMSIQGEEGDRRIGEEPDVSDEATAIPSKSRTLEDATDVILLCSSIVHEIAYNAANIAMNRESSPAGGVPRPPPAAALLFPSPRTTSSGRRSKKTRPRKSVVSESKSPQSVLGEKKEAGRRISSSSSSPPRIVGSTTTVIPPKLESKCNCSIM
ncbi:hypothetical protein M569_06624 [Genlisea aurea]|uniref:Uncharacterized protein n=1 Tax=Genlisea aurea TaxID=192259 RepID=S8CN47_9LAMI|nr:hypothetical protein M569_06624 [Genlisea aurea]